jgi:acetolactate synthase regulatory subunit
MHLQDESSSVISRSLRAISKFNIKVIAASQKEIQEYASEAEKLENDRNIKIISMESAQEIT